MEGSGVTVQSRLEPLSAPNEQIRTCTGTGQTRNGLYPEYMVPAQEEPGSMVPKACVPKPGTSGVWYPREYRIL